MSERRELENHVRETRLRRGWSQDELARRSGLSRAGVSAIENERLVPSTSAALSLASAFGCRVEDLFRLPQAASAGRWAWPPLRVPCRYWSAELADGVRLYPVEVSALGVLPHDGTYEGGELPSGGGGAEAGRTLVLASCDPAVGLLASELARASDVRLIVLSRPSRAALGLLKQGLVHAAGVHLSAADQADGNAAVAKQELGPGCTLLRVAEWDEGIALAPGRSLGSVRAALRADLCWVGREGGSGARQCLDELLDGRAPARLASDHRGVAEAVRQGWADAGVCLRLASEEAGLDFLSVRQEAYDLCLPGSWKQDERLRALVSVVRSPSYRRTLGELPGYNSAGAGALQNVV